MPKYLPINCLFRCIIDKYYSRLDFQLTDPVRLLDEALARLILDGHPDVPAEKPPTDQGPPPVTKPGSPGAAGRLPANCTGSVGAAGPAARKINP